MDKGIPVRSHAVSRGGGGGGTLEVSHAEDFGLPFSPPAPKNI